ncbi:PREDICTED: suppressor protein SRP40 isoform X2 [Populus euphratica]|uniref:Suppressor protein SRP40 isoform X1 n=1 Tax=Populus euphratica TaxID=75702 RepID=A0AAJ6TY53_POPEU|nr:PREDICTED: suppressor protein SRP40 isoform X1 [Populus euphratica]XP_011019280.1 PREDICTED: suppressor protein SRP40 isoform X2 [Populus euphratica]
MAEKMTAPGKEEKVWSESKKMEGRDSWRTLECLRGRLLAERQASKIAKEEAELMGNKLIELENKLREETRLRKKAEKKHKLLMKKLESLKISPTLEGSEKSSLSDNSGFSSTSSTSTSGHKDPEESESKPQSTIQALSLDMKDNGSETTTSNQNACIVLDSIQESTGTQDTQNSNSEHNLKDYSLDKSSHESMACSQDSKADDLSSSSIKASVVEMETNAGIESDNEDYVDDSLALVPMSFPASTKKNELRIVKRSVIEVLDALRHAREQIQSSMESRHMIRVGPS